MPDVPVTSLPASVPNENTAPVTVVAAVTPVMLIGVALLADKVPVIAPLLSVKSRALINCPTLFGFASRSLSVTVIVPGPVTHVAVASTAPSEVVAPVGVENVSMAARAWSATPKDSAKRGKAQRGRRNLSAHADAACLVSEWRPG